MDSSPSQSPEHMHNWLRKLKESQERRRDEKIRRYNDVVSKLIILLIGVCIICVIVIAALVVNNENLKNEMKQVIAANQTNYDSQQKRITALENQTVQLQEFIISNKTLNIDHTVYVPPDRPAVSKIVYNNTMISIDFVDGNRSTTSFVGYTINVE